MQTTGPPRGLTPPAVPDAPPVRRSTFRHHPRILPRIRRTPGSGGGTPRSGGRESRRRWWPRVVLAVVALLTVAVVTGFAYMWWSWESVPVATGLGPLPAVQKVETVLLVGSDSRAEVEGGRFGGSSVTGQRADTILLLVMPPGHAKATAVSIPRDLRVEIPGKGTGKLNAAFNGGASSMVPAVQSATGMTVNHYLEINFDGLRDLSKAAGGVVICTDHPVRDKFSDLDLPNPGCQNLQGDMALAWVRSRHHEELVDGKWQQDPTGDLGRIKRQQEFLTKLMGSLAEPDTMLHMPDLASAVQKDFRRDPGFSYWHLLHTGMRFMPSPSSQLQFTTLPVEPKTIGGVSFVVPQQPEMKQLLSDLQEGRVPAVSS